MRMMLLSVVLAFILIVGCSISNSEMAGSEIGNPSITAIVLDSSDQPVVGAKVALYEEGAISPFVTTQTNDTGYFEISDLEPGDYSLEVFQSDSTHLIYVNRVSHDTAIGIMHLLRPAQLSGVVVADTTITSVRLSGTHYVAQVDDEGEFFFPYVPSGTYDLLGEVSGGVGDESLVLSEVTLTAASESRVVYGEVQSSDEVSSSTISSSSSHELVSSVAKGESSVVETLSSLVQDSSYTFINGGSLLLDDFEDQNSYNALQPKLGWGNWSVFDDAPEGGGSTVTPENSTPDKFISAIKAGSGEGGSYGLLVTYVLDWYGIDEPRVGVAVDIGRGAYDLTPLTSISFDLRGDALMVIEFERDVVIDGVVQPLRAGWSKQALDGWQNVTLEPSNIEINTFYHPEGYGIVQLMPYVYRIRFSAISGTQFALDNIEINGMSLP